MDKSSALNAVPLKSPLHGRRWLRIAQGIFGFLICFTLTYVPLWFRFWARYLPTGIAPAFLIVWLPVAQFIPLVLLWRRNRAFALGFVVYIGCELMFIIAMFLGLVPPV